MCGEGFCEVSDKKRPVRGGRDCKKTILKLFSKKSRMMEQCYASKKKNLVKKRKRVESVGVMWRRRK